MSELRKVDKEGRELCTRCLHWRERTCSRVDCGVRHEITAAPPAADDVTYIGSGCSIRMRHPGAE